MIHLFDITIFLIDITDCLPHNAALGHPDDLMVVGYQTQTSLLHKPRQGEGMQQKDERRVLERYNNDAPIVYAYQDTDHFFHAVMCNYSNEGMCFKTTKAVDPGSDLYIMMENYSPDTVHADLYEGYFVEVRWCRQLSSCEVPAYQVGVKYYKTIIE